MPNRVSLPVWSLALSMLSAVLTPAGASAQVEHDRHLRLSANLGLGFAGEYDASASSSLGTVRTENDLDPTVGFGLRAEMPILDFLSVGVLFEALSYEPDASGAERDWAFDFDALVRVRYMFDVMHGELFLEPYAALPIGFTFAMLDDPDGDGDEAWPGWNIAALAGFAVITSSRFGGFIELGWRHLEVYTDVSTALGDADFAVTTNEFAVNLGAMFLLQ